MLADGKQRNTTLVSEMTKWREKGMMFKNGLGQGRGSWDKTATRRGWWRPSSARVADERKMVFCPLGLTSRPP